MALLCHAFVDLNHLNDNECEELMYIVDTVMSDRMGGYPVAVHIKNYLHFVFLMDFTLLN